MVIQTKRPTSVTLIALILIIFTLIALFKIFSDYSKIDVKLEFLITGMPLRLSKTINIVCGLINIFLGITLLKGWKKAPTFFQIYIPCLILLSIYFTGLMLAHAIFIILFVIGFIFLEKPEAQEFFNKN